MTCRRGSRLLGALSLVAAAFGVAQLVARRMTSGDEAADEFRLVVLGGGREFQSRATSLREASVLAVFGGVEMDLSQATADAHGARLDITACFGGLQVTVPPGWAVEVEQRGQLGGIDARVADEDSLPDDAPRLHVRANTWFGGVQILSRQG